MDAALIDVLDAHGHVQQRQRLAGPGSQCRIGRSLTCDIVLDDDYAAAEHTELVLQEDGRVRVKDLGTRNGTRVNDQRIGAGEALCITGGELRIGRTLVRVRTGQAQLPPERLFRRDPLRRHRTWLAGAGMALCLVFAVLSQWLAARENMAARMLIAVLAMLCVLAIWVGVWSLVARLSIGAWRVRIHLALAALFIALCAWGYALYSIAAFATQWHLPGIMLGLGAALAWAAAYLHLRNATPYPPQVALALAVLAPLLLGGVLWLVDLQLDPRSVNRVQMGPDVYPAAVRLAPSTDLADFLADAATLKRAANRNRQQSLLETPLQEPDD